MSSQKSSPTGSHPDLTKLRECNLATVVPSRKRKTPNSEIADFLREHAEILSLFRQDILNTLSNFQNELTSTFKELFHKQNESIMKLCDDFSELKAQVRRYPRHSTSKDGLPDAKSPDMSNIIVRFTQRSKKNDLLAAVRARRGLYTSDLDIDGPASVVFVNDHLAPYNKILYSQVRAMGRSKGYKYIWINDCNIFLRKNDTSKAIHISNSDDLSKVK
ncbi:hypothetical protein ACJJTC_004865 [Scirpophaga incertulas]